jgi:hypothetical protein
MRISDALNIEFHSPWRFRGREADGSPSGQTNAEALAAVSVKKEMKGSFRTPARYALGLMEIHDRRSTWSCFSSRRTGTQGLPRFVGPLDIEDFA